MWKTLQLCDFDWERHLWQSAAWLIAQNRWQYFDHHDHDQLVSWPANMYAGFDRFWPLDILLATLWQCIWLIARSRCYSWIRKRTYALVLPSSYNHKMFVCYKKGPKIEAGKIWDKENRSLNRRSTLDFSRRLWRGWYPKSWEKWNSLNWMF